MHHANAVATLVALLLVVGFRQEAAAIRHPAWQHAQVSHVTSSADVGDLGSKYGRGLASADYDAWATQLEAFSGLQVSIQGSPAPAAGGSWKLEIAPVQPNSGNSSGGATPTPASSSSSGHGSNATSPASSGGNQTSSNQTSHQDPSNAALDSSQLLQADPKSSSSSSSSSSSNGTRVAPLAYTYNYVNGSEGNPLGLPIAATPGLVLPRWVMCAWSVSNFSSPLMLNDRTMYQVQELINNFTAMAPGQVQLSATANVTVGYTFSGISTWTDAASGALTRAASDMAGGYDPSLIDILLTPPDFGVSADEFTASAAQPVREVPANSLTIGGSPISMLTQGTTGSSPQQTRVWVAYSRMAPLNVTELLNALSASCGGVSLEGGVNLTGTPCGAATRALLAAAGVAVDSSIYAQHLQDTPMVSLSVRLAIGVTESQVAAGTDKALANWLSQPRNIRNAINVSNVPDPIGPHAVIKWLLPPEIWHSRVLPQLPVGATGLRPGAAVGIALGCVAALGLLLGLGLFLTRHHRQTADAHKDGGSSISGGRRRRRRQAKPRYLRPEMPAAVAAAAAAASAAAAAEGGAAGPDAAADVSDPLSPDQIRPAMKELGDSVTSAARFELDDDDDEQQDTTRDTEARDTGAAAGSSAGTAGAAAAAAGVLPMSQRVLAARAALLAEHQQASAGGASGGGSSAVPGAAAALAASGSADSEPDLVSSRGGWVPGEQQPGMTPPPAAAASGVSGLGSVPPLLPLSAEGAAAPLGSQQQQRLAHHPAAKPSPRSFPLRSLQVSPEPDSNDPEDPAAAAGIGVSPGWCCLGPPTPQPLDLAALGLVGPSPLPKPGPGGPGVLRASPFALAYDFGDLADAAPEAAGGSSGAAVAAGASAAADSAAAVDEAGLANSGSCSAGMVTAGSALAAAAAPPSVSSNGLQGIGSTKIALSYDGSFTTVEEPAALTHAHKYSTAGSGSIDCRANTSSSGPSSAVLVGWGSTCSSTWEAPNHSSSAPGSSSWRSSHGSTGSGSTPFSPAGKAQVGSAFALSSMPTALRQH